MTTKTFQAETIMEALLKVQEEMGPDAVVISARNIPIGPAWQVWKKPGVEVISISPDEMDKAQNIATNNRNLKNEVLRPSKDGKGVEFIEERPAIEWETYTSAPASVKPGPAKVHDRQNPDDLPADNAKIYRQPRYQDKDDSRPVNPIIARHSQALQDEKENGKSTDWHNLRTNQRSILPANRSTYFETLNKLLGRLAYQGIEVEYLKLLENLAIKGCSPDLLSKEAKVKEFLANSMAANLPIRKWPASEAPGRVMIFIGLSGIGKTSSLAKVAVHYSSLLGKKVVWICADSVRTGAILEARAYTEAIGIPLELAYTPADLRAAVNKYEDADLILVDTPGFNPCVEEQEVQLGSLLVEVPEAQIYLVTSASAKETDSMRCFQSLKYFGIKGSVLSKMDETTTYGSVFNFSLKSRLPITFFTSGRRAATGLRIADAGLLVNSLFGKGW